MSAMRALLALAAFLLVPLVMTGTAVAQSAPPDSEFDQYVPDIPGSKGDRPLGDVKGEEGGEGASDALPQGVAEELRSRGPEGEIVAGLAEATAPEGDAKARGGQKGGGGTPSTVAAGDAGDSFLGAILDALTGAPGGLGVALPLALLAALAGGAWYALRRRRAAGDGPAESRDG
jgi:hypothetical protein